MSLGGRVSLQSDVYNTRSLFQEDHPTELQTDCRPERTRVVSRYRHWRKLHAHEAEESRGFRHRDYEFRFNSFTGRPQIGCGSYQ